MKIYRCIVTFDFLPSITVRREIERGKDRERSREIERGFYRRLEEMRKWGFNSRGSTKIKSLLRFKKAKNRPFLLFNYFSKCPIEQEQKKVRGVTHVSSGIFSKQAWGTVPSECIAFKSSCRHKKGAVECKKIRKTASSWGCALFLRSFNKL